MLRIIVEGDECFNDETQTFETFTDVVMELEHSLISLSKWESEYQKPFLVSGEKTLKEIFDYLKFMVVTSTGDLDALYRCSQENIDQVQKYIDSSQSATTFGMMPELCRYHPIIN